VEQGNPGNALLEAASGTSREQRETDTRAKKAPGEWRESKGSESGASCPGAASGTLGPEAPAVGVGSSSSSSNPTFNKKGEVSFGSERLSFYENSTDNFLKRKKPAARADAKGYKYFFRKIQPPQLSNKKCRQAFSRTSVIRTTIKNQSASIGSAVWGMIRKQRKKNYGSRTPKSR
jgi:hypothetical protein